MAMSVELLPYQANTEIYPRRDFRFRACFQAVALLFVCYLSILIVFPTHMALTSITDSYF